MQENISNENCMLGLQLDKFDDKIIFYISNICEKISEVLTKRSLIQFIPNMFDPLGLLNPVIVKHGKFAWDDILPESYLSVFDGRVNGLPGVQKKFLAFKLLKIL